jgi:hypothetical protein
MKLFKNAFFYTSLLSLIALGLIIGSYVFGWLPPTATPPSSNLPAPINVSSTGQSKVGYLAIGTSTAPTIPLNVSGTVNMTTLSIGGTAVTATGAQLNYVAGVTSAIQTQLNAKEPTISAGTTAQYWRGDKTWQTSVSGIPAGMIAMFDTACPTGWTRFSALDNRFPQGATTYGATGGTTSHTHAIDPPLTYTAGQDYNGVQGCDPGGGSGACHKHETDVVSFISDSASHLPPYLNVIWCKKD